jgi:glycosyltransferase involved in cell wall biosynthesis
VPDFSVITVVSRPEIYESCLLKSLAATRKGHDIEIIPILNEDNRYSASNALNIGIDVARSDTLIFVHQDVRLLYGWFDTLKQFLSEVADDMWGIIGSAGIALKYGRYDIGKWGGALFTDTVAVGSVWDADDKLGQVPYWDGLKELTPVHCADECLLVMNKKTGLRFDSLFQGFHFYGVDLCLQARAAAYACYCAHLPIVHYGKYSASFTGDKKYWVYLRYLHHKWKFRFPEVLGTHFHWAFEADNATPELTSYIDVTMDGGEGFHVHLKAMGVNDVKLRSDHRLLGGV